MSCAFSALWCAGVASPNVPFAALTLRWAIDGLGFQPVFWGTNLHFSRILQLEFVCEYWRMAYCMSLFAHDIPFFVAVCRYLLTV